MATIKSKGQRRIRAVTSQLLLGTDCRSRGRCCEGSAVASGKRLANKPVLHLVVFLLLLRTMHRSGSVFLITTELRQKTRADFVHEFGRQLPAPVPFLLQLGLVLWVGFRLRVFGLTLVQSMEAQQQKQQQQHSKPHDFVASHSAAEQQHQHDDDVQDERTAGVVNVVVGAIISGGDNLNSPQEQEQQVHHRPLC